MKRRSIYFLSLLILILFFLVSVFDTTGMVLAQASPSLALRLVGTAVTNDPSKSFAIIEYQPTGNQGVVREGDRLGDIVIKRILSGYVIIVIQNGEQTLSIGTGGSAGNIESSPQMTQIDRKEVDSTLPEYMQLMQEIRIRPHFEEGQPGGFYVTRIEPDSIFAKMGLENGDVILAVNGMPITKTIQAVEFYNALKRGGTVNLEIQRDETKQELHFVIQ